MAARVAAGAALAWIVALPFAIAPDYFPWFNALAGKHPEHVLIDSDLDWGQDLFRLQRELRDVTSTTSTSRSSAHRTSAAIRFRA